MTFDEMSREVRRFAAILGRPFDQADQQSRMIWLQEVYRKFSWMNVSQWELLVNRVVDKHKKRSLPSVSELSEYVHSMRRTGVIPPVSKEICKSCGGIGFVFKNYKFTGPHGYTVPNARASYPCPSCRKSVMWDTKPEYQEITLEDIP